VGFVVDGVELGQIFSEYFGFPQPNFIPPNFSTITTPLRKKRQTKVFDVLDVLSTDSNYVFKPWTTFSTLDTVPFFQFMHCYHLVGMKVQMLLHCFTCAAILGAVCCAN
jgi:hypothetical protein